MKKFLIILLLVIVLISLAYRIDMRRTPHEMIGELMYFPSGYAVRAVSMGFQAPLADVVWLRFIQYYGQHRMTDARFELMYHILDILTTLDPKFMYAYTLGGLMLTHDAERPDQAGLLLKKGMLMRPDDWRLPFVYAFINCVFTNDYPTAKRFFGLSARKPSAPDTPKRWQAFVTYMKLGDLKTALALWVDYYNQTKNPEEKMIAEIYIKSIKMKLDIEFLNEKVQEFTMKFGRPPVILSELVTSGIVEAIPEEPHGEHYHLKGNSVYSTWKRGTQ
jgi:hypothetical protein